MTLNLTVEAQVLQAAMGVGALGIGVGLFYVWAKYLQRKD